MSIICNFGCRCKQINSTPIKKISYPEKRAMHSKTILKNSLRDKLYHPISPILFESYN